MYSYTHSEKWENPEVVWHSVLAKHCLAFETPAASANFEASLEVRLIGGLPCTRIMQAGAIVRRTRREISRNPSEEILLILQMGGQAQMQQGPNYAFLQPGALILIDPMQPSQFQFGRKSIQLSLHIPRSAFETTFPFEILRFAQTLPRFTSSVIGWLVQTAFDKAADDSRCGLVLIEAITKLVKASFLEASPADADDPAPSPNHVLLGIQDYVIAHLDEDLSPARLAKEANVSERHLHRLFQKRGTSACRWIREQRLDRCAANMRDPASNGLSLTTIAFNNGFNDVAHFSRTFKEQFGETPLSYRRRFSSQ